MAQQFDPDSVKAIERVIQDLESGAISKLGSAIERVREQAQSSGNGNLITSVSNAAEVGIPAFEKAYKELLESLQNYVNQAKKIFAATGVDY